MMETKKPVITDAMVKAIRPHLIDAVRHNVARWDAERRIELELAALLEREVEIANMRDAYDDLCFAVDDPKTARRIVTTEATRDFLDSVLGEI